MVEEKTAREVKKLLNELVDHSYHHRAYHNQNTRGMASNPNQDTGGRLPVVVVCGVASGV